jgi:hypothetical protein
MAARAVYTADMTTGRLTSRSPASRWCCGCACGGSTDRAGERIGLTFIPPGRSWRNGYIESINGGVRDERLNLTQF